MQSLHEASYAVALKLFEIGCREGRLPVITGIYNIENDGDGEVSIWLELDDEASNGSGIIWVHLPAALVDGVDKDFLLRVLTGWRPTLDLNCIDTLHLLAVGAGEAAVPSVAAASPI